MEDIYLKIKVVPRASCTKWMEEMSDGTKKLALKALPEKGKANLELIRFLAKEYNIKKERVKLISGATSRVKLVKIMK